MKRQAAERKVAAEQDETPLEEVARLLKEERNKWRKRFAIWGLVLAGFFVNQLRISDTANEAKTAAHQATTALNLVIAQRDESRLFNCMKDRKFATAHNKLVYTLANSGREDRSAVEQAKVDALAAQQYVAVPDCSPEGIAAFYAGQGGTTPPPVPAPTSSTEAPSTTTRARRSSSTTGQPATTTHPTSATSTTYPSSPTPTPRPCTGITLPGGLPCLG